MKPNKRALSLIGFKRDYDIHEDFQTHSFEVRSGDIRSRMKVGVSFGDSAEFLLVETYDKLDKVRRRDSAAWNGPRMFEELEQCLSGTALGAFRTIVSRDYNTDALKTAASYGELKKKIITTLSDFSYPGDKVIDYLTGKLHYLNCKDADGDVMKPVDVLARLREIRELGGKMHHNQGVIPTSPTPTSWRRSGRCSPRR